jgi:hypothetical protein
MSQIELAVALTRRLESLLEEKHQATGKGLHEKVSSVESRLPSQLVKSLRYIATMRNSIVHEDGFVIADIDGFTAQGNAALAQLGGTPLGADTSPKWFDLPQGLLMLSFKVACGTAGAYSCWKGFGGAGAAVMGLVGGWVIGAYALSIARKVGEILLRLILIGCALGLIVSFFR